MAMPWRFSNVTATLLVPVSVAAIAAIIDRMDERDALVARTIVALLVAAFGVAMAGLLGFAGRLAVERQMLAVLWGLPFGFGLWLIRSAPRQMGHLLLPMIAIATAAAPFWSDSKAALYLAGATTACIIAVGAGRLLVGGFVARFLTRASAPVMAAAIVVCAVGMLTARAVDARQPSEEDWDRISADDVTIDKWLSQNAGADEPVLAAIYPRVELQAKTRQPVLLEFETLFLMTYLPDLAPQIGTMVRDLYGIDYEHADAVARQCRSGLVRPWCDVWTEAWKSRTPGRWSELAGKYHFRFVVAPAAFGVNLPVRLQTARANVYEIPPAFEANTH
jgi:hypothetical protein